MAENSSGVSNAPKKLVHIELFGLPSALLVLTHSQSLYNALNNKWSKKNYKICTTSAVTHMLEICCLGFLVMPHLICNVNHFPSHRFLYIYTSHTQNN